MCCRKINQQYVYGDISQIEALQEAQLQIYTPNTKFWWRLAELVYAPAQICALVDTVAKNSDCMGPLCLLLLTSFAHAAAASFGMRDEALRSVHLP